MCKYFETNRQEGISKLVSFSRYPLNIYYRTRTGKLVLIQVSCIPGIENFADQKIAPRRLPPTNPPWVRVGGNLPMGNFPSTENYVIF